MGRRKMYHTGRPRHSTRYAVKALIDYDYWGKLSPEEQAYLKLFTVDFYYAGLGKILKLPKNQRASINRYAEQDSRRRSVLPENAVPLPAEPEHIDPTDAVIQLIDIKRKLAKKVDN